MTAELTTGGRSLADVEVFPLGSNMRFVAASEVKPERVSWLWRGRIPARGLVALAGAGGSGKSTLAQAMAAHVTTGRALPGEDLSTPRTVMILSAEEDAAAVLVPRLAAYGADLDRVVIRDPNDLGPLGFPHHMERLEVECRERDIGFLVVDPGTGFLSPGFKSNSDEDVRSAFAPLAQLAVALDMVALLVLHTNKGQMGGAGARVLGSVAWRNLPRVVLLLAPPEGLTAAETTERVLVVEKSNLSKYPPAMGVQLLESTDNPDIAVAEFTGEITGVYADDLVGVPATPEERSAAREAEDWLVSHLTANGSRPAKDVLSAASSDGISHTTLNRVKKRAGVISRRDGDRWIWERQDDPLRDTDNLDRLDNLGVGNGREADGQAVPIVPPKMFKPHRPLTMFSGDDHLARQAVMADQIREYLAEHPDAGDREVAMGIGSLPTAAQFRSAMAVATRGDDADGI